MSKGLATISAPLLLPLPDGVTYCGIQPGTVDMMTFHVRDGDRTTAFAIKGSHALSEALARALEGIRARQDAPLSGLRSPLSGL
jgi:hypothetical protein